MPIIASGPITYGAGLETANYVVPVPGTAQAGDVLVVKLDSAVSATALTGIPGEASVLLAQSENPNANHRDGGLYGIPISSSPPASYTFTWAAAVRGNVVWTLLRGHTVVGAVAAASTWGLGNGIAPSVTATAGAWVLGGISQGSGSATITNPPSPWVTLASADERRGWLASKGVQASAGSTGTATFNTTSSAWRRAWQVMLPEASGPPPDPPIEAELTTTPYPTFTGDVADGAAIVFDAASPSSSVVIGTNKGDGGGLYVFNLDGTIRSSVLPGAANSVDWRDLSAVSGWDTRLLVMTTDRQANLLRYFWMDRTTKALTAAGTTSLGWEPYGSCLYVHSTGQVYAFVSQRGPDDTSARNWYQYPLTRSTNTVVAGAAARTVSVTSVVEGMAADDATGYLYMSQEDVGLYRYSAAPGGGSTRTTIDTVGAGNLVADVEDVAVARNGSTAKLLVSSQGDSSYHVYDLTTLAHEQRFTVVRPGGSNQVTGTDGLDVYLGNFGSTFPNGLIVVHDGDQTPVSDFAFVDAEPVFGEIVKVARGSSVVSVNASAQGSGRKSVRRSGTTTVQTSTVGSGRKSVRRSSIVAVATSTISDGFKRMRGASLTSVLTSVLGEGAKTGRGASVTGVEVTTQGSGRRAQSGRGGSIVNVTVGTQDEGSKSTRGASVTSVSVSEQGEGSKAARGSSIVNVDTTTQGSGRRVQSGRGSSVVDVVVSTVGEGVKVARGGSVVTVGVSTVGSGRRPSSGRGSSVVTVNVGTQGQGRKIARGSSVVSVGLIAVGQGYNPESEKIPVPELTLTGTGIVTTLKRVTPELTLEQV